MPEVKKAFGYRATRFEGFKIAAYGEEDAGFFAPHRDNLSPNAKLVRAGNAQRTASS